MVGRERNVVKHLSEEELDRLQAEADEIKEALTELSETA